MMSLPTLVSVISDTIDAFTSPLDEVPSGEDSPSISKCGVSEAMEDVFLCSLGFSVDASTSSLDVRICPGRCMSGVWEAMEDVFMCVEINLG